MNESEIISAIEQKKGTTQYSIWTVGITDNPERRKSEHETAGENATYWKDWEADTEAIARSVEAYFLDKGMKGATGGGDRPTHVYIF